MAPVVARIQKQIGPPRNYGPTPEEQVEIQRKEEEERTKREAEERAAREKAEAEEAVERKRRQDEWAQRLEKVRREEHTMLELLATPMRNYLMQNVMPKLTEALMDCGKVRPDDPVDYLVSFHVSLCSDHRG